MTALPYVYPVQIVGLVVAPIQRYLGRPGHDPVSMPDEDRRAVVRVLEGKGIEGDRYFNKPAHRRGQVTVMSAESVDEVAAELGRSDGLDPLLARRNVVVRGVQVDAVLGHRISLDSGAGPVLLGALSPARPCGWMNDVFAPGAQKAMRGRSGLRCEALSSGTLRLGAARLLSEIRL
jgi:MOSC domain-containing protein YiiM